MKSRTAGNKSDPAETLRVAATEANVNAAAKILTIVQYTRSDLFVVLAS